MPNHYTALPYNLQVLFPKNFNKIPILFNSLTVYNRQLKVPVWPGAMNGNDCQLSIQIGSPLPVLGTRHSLGLASTSTMSGPIFLMQFQGMMKSS